MTFSHLYFFIPNELIDCWLKNFADVSCLTWHFTSRLFQHDFSVMILLISQDGSRTCASGTRPTDHPIRRISDSRNPSFRSCSGSAGWDIRCTDTRTKSGATWYPNRIPGCLSSTKMTPKACFRWRPWRLIWKSRTAPGVETWPGRKILRWFGILLIDQVRIPRALRTRLWIKPLYDLGYRALQCPRLIKTRLDICFNHHSGLRFSMSTKLTHFLTSKKGFLQFINRPPYVMSSSWFELLLSVNIWPWLKGSQQWPRTLLN